MSEIVLAKDAKAGHWYEDSDGYRFLCCGCWRFVASDLVLVALCIDSEMTHLPDCTGWDWQPPKPEKKYRPFASMEEWWPHRQRWYRDRNGSVVCGWLSVNRAKLDFQDGAVFLNDDGTDCEPFGAEVTE